MVCACTHRNPPLQKLPNVMLPQASSGCTLLLCAAVALVHPAPMVQYPLVFHVISRASAPHTVCPPPHPVCLPHAACPRPLPPPCPRPHPVPPPSPALPAGALHAARCVTRCSRHRRGPAVPVRAPHRVAPCLRTPTPVHTHHRPPRGSGAARRSAADVAQRAGRVRPCVWCGRH